MTPPAGPRLSRPLHAHYAAVVRALIVRHALGAAGLAALALAVAVAAGVALPLSPATAWARLTVAGVALLFALGLAIAAFRRERPAFERYLETIEERFPAMRSWLRNALDFESGPPAHTSAELHAALGREAAERVAGLPLGTLRPAVRPMRPLAALAAALVVIAALAVAMPRRAEESWRTLWNPSAAAPPVRLEVEPGSVRVSPGTALAVHARVWGTAATPRIWRDGEPAPEATAEGSQGGGDRLWRFDLAQLTRAQRYRVRVGGAQSPVYTIALAGEPRAVSFDVEIHAPAYARLPVQKGTATRGDLSALRGSRAVVEALFDRDLESVSARMPGGATVAWTARSPRRWRGEARIDREGEWELTATAAGGTARFRYPVEPLPDAPPVIAVRVPQGDLDLPAGSQIPLDVLGQDDLGLAELRLQYRKDPGAPWTAVSLARFAGAPREAEVEHRWDASVLGLLPGQVAAFRFELDDNNVVSGPGRAVSPVFQVRFPSLADLYDRVDQRQSEAQSALKAVAEQAKDLQKSIDKLSHDVRPAPAPGTNFEKREELKSALARQQDLAKRIEDTAREVHESLAEAAERQVFDDQVMRKLQEIGELMKQIQSQELKDAVRKLQESLEKMDRRDLTQNLQQWRDENQRMLQNLERTAQLLKELREEEKLESLAQRAEEQKAQQDALNQEMQAPERDGAHSDPKQDLAQREDKAAEESQKLAEEAKEMAESLEEPGDRDSLQQASQSLSEEASPSQREAAKSMSQPQQAGKQGQKASQGLSKAAQTMRNMLTQRQQRREGVDLAALRRAARDLVSIQRENEQNQSSGAASPERADKDEDLSEGVSRIADSLSALSKRTPFIRPELSEALGRAIHQLSGAAKQLDQGNRPGGEQSGKSASQALNEAVLQLRQTESSMCQNPGSKPGQNPHPGASGQSMAKLTDRQGQLNHQSRQLSQRLTQQMQMTQGDEAEMRRLADEQQRIREQLSQIEKDEQAKQHVLGRLDQTKQEMQQVEEQLRQGSTGGDLEEKQVHILSRLLDAQRSVNRQDFDPQRESKPGEDVTRVSPAPLPAELLRENDRLRLDLLKAEADRYPAQYRAFVEAYLRSLNGSRR